MKTVKFLLDERISDLFDNYNLCATLFKAVSAHEEEDKKYYNLLLSYLKSSKEFIFKLKEVKNEFKGLSNELQGLEKALLRNFKVNSLDEILEYLEKEEIETTKKIKAGVDNE